MDKVERNFVSRCKSKDLIDLRGKRRAHMETVLHYL